MTQKYKIKHIRFRVFTNNSPIKNNIIAQLYSCVSSDYSCYKIVNEFFFTQRSNNKDKHIILRRLNRLKDEQELDGYSVDSDTFDEVKKVILNLFENPSVTHHYYQNIFTGYFEYIVMKWKKIPGRDGKVFFEPLIKYKRKELFRGEPFANIKCDVVFKNSKTKTLSFYECKFGIRTFLSDLQVDLNSGSVISRVKRAHRKIDYLNQCKNLFSKSPLSDVKDNETLIMTLARRSTVENYLEYFRGIKIMSREEIESKSFYEQLL